MLEGLKANFRDLASGRPGDRFQRRWRGLCAREGPWRRAGFVTLGAFLVALGFVLGPAPVVPGFIPLLAGLAMIAGRSSVTARALDRGELRLRRAWCRVRRRLR